MILLVSHNDRIIQETCALIEATFPEETLQIVSTGIKGLSGICTSPPGVVIVDAALPDISGIQLCRVLKQDPTLQKLPLLCLIDGNNEEYKRLSELSPIADSFISADKLDQHLAVELKAVFDLFEKLDPQEKSQLTFLQNHSVQVDATSRLIQLLDQAITESAVMKGFNHLFERVPERDVLTHMMFSLLENVLDYDVCGVFFNDRLREPRLITYHVRTPGSITETALETLNKEILDQLKPQSKEPWNFHQYRHTVLYPDDFIPAKANDLKYKALYPFKIDNDLVGALVFFNRKNTNYDIIFPFQLVLAQTAALMRIRHYYSEARLFTIVDAQTGLYTEPHFLWCLEREIRQAKRHRKSLSLVALRIDPQPSELMLQHVSQRILSTFRNVDLFARIGTTGILGILPNTTSDQAQGVLTRFQDQIALHPLLCQNKPLSLSVSAGLTMLTDEIDSLEQLIGLAQKALKKTEKVKSGKPGVGAIQLLF